MQNFISILRRGCSQQIPSLLLQCFMVALWNRADHYIFILWFLLLSSIFLFFSSPNLCRRRLDVCHTSTHGVALTANLRCRSETCCTRLAANTGRKKSSKICHLGTIAQLCRAISLQLRHVSTIGKTLFKKQYLLHMSPQYSELRPTG